MRTSRDCPAGMVTSPPEAEPAKLFAGAGAAAGAGATTGAERPALPVNVSATASVVLKVWTSPLISKRKTACVPPRYFPFNTRPSLNSKVSAAAAPTKNSPKTTATKKRFKLFIVPSHDSEITIPGDLRIRFPARPIAILPHWMAETCRMVARNSIVGSDCSRKTGKRLGCCRLQQKQGLSPEKAWALRCTSRHLFRQSGEWKREWLIARGEPGPHPQRGPP